MDGPAFLGRHFAKAVQRVAKDVEQAAEGAAPDGDADGLALVDGLGATGQALRGAQGQTPHPAVAQVLLDLKHHLLAIDVHVDGGVNGGEPLGRELHVHNGPDNLHHVSNGPKRHDPPTSSVAS